MCVHYLGVVHGYMLFRKLVHYTKILALYGTAVYTCIALGTIFIIGGEGVLREFNVMRVYSLCPLVLLLKACCRSGRALGSEK